MHTVLLFAFLTYRVTYVDHSPKSCYTFHFSNPPSDTRLFCIAMLRTVLTPYPPTNIMTRKPSSYNGRIHGLCIHYVLLETERCTTTYKVRSGDCIRVDKHLVPPPTIQPSDTQQKDAAPKSSWSRFHHSCTIFPSFPSKTPARLNESTCYLRGIESEHSNERNHFTSQECIA